MTVRAGVTGPHAARPLRLEVRSSLHTAPARECIVSLMESEGSLVSLKCRHILSRKPHFTFKMGNLLFPREQGKGRAQDQPPQKKDHPNVTLSGVLPSPRLCVSKNPRRGVKGMGESLVVFNQSSREPPSDCRGTHVASFPAGRVGPSFSHHDLNLLKDSFGSATGVCQPRRPQN